MRRFPRAIFILILFLIFTPFAHAEDRFFDSAGVKIRVVVEEAGHVSVLEKPEFREAVEAFLSKSGD